MEHSFVKKPREIYLKFKDPDSTTVLPLISAIEVDISDPEKEFLYFEKKKGGWRLTYTKSLKLHESSKFVSINFD